MIYRRYFLTLAAASVWLSVSHAAHAQPAEKAASFIKSTGDKIVDVVNSPGSPSSKRAAMTQIVDRYVDVDEIGRFCLGRYWRQATPEQKKQYLSLFREVLVTNITSKVGEYQGVRFTMGRSRMEDEDAVVSTTVDRPNNPPAAVDWLVSNPGSNPRIIDVKAEGTSLRLTQRQDYASYLAHNNNNIDALITAMRNQVSQSSQAG
jgi:phospholipid transport system substrate-binding protein